MGLPPPVLRPEEMYLLLTDGSLLFPGHNRECRLYWQVWKGAGLQFSPCLEINKIASQMPQPHSLQASEKQRSQNIKSVAMAIVITR